jgi:MSHA pilin protein MshC
MPAGQHGVSQNWLTLFFAGVRPILVSSSGFRVPGSTSKVQGMNLPELKPGTWNPERCTRMARARGFTIVELVIIIAITGLLGALLGPRFIGRDAFASRGFHDEAQMVVRYAQKTAIAWRRTVYVCVTATAVKAGSLNNSCASSLLVHPATGAPLTTTAPSGVTLTSSSFSFDGAGRPNPNAQVTITFTSTITGDPARVIVVEAETGYVHP